MLHRFITTIFYSAFDASSPLHFQRKSSLNASLPLIFKVALPISEYEPSIEKLHRTTAVQM
jgi:hypothetical protein